MKNLVKTFAIAALAAITFTSNADNGKSKPSKSKTFEIGMYQSINTLQMNVMIEKATDKNITVVLKNQYGKVLYKGNVDKNSAVYHGRYDMKGLEDGTYTFEFTKGDEKIVKEVNLTTQQATDENRIIQLD
jgi:hypothetical protein